MKAVTPVDTARALEQSSFAGGGSQLSEPSAETILKIRPDWDTMYISPRASWPKLVTWLMLTPLVEVRMSLLRLVTETLPFFWGTADQKFERT